MEDFHQKIKRLSEDRAFREQRPILVVADSKGSKFVVPESMFEADDQHEILHRFEPPDVEDVEYEDYEGPHNISVGDRVVIAGRRGSEDEDSMELRTIVRQSPMRFFTGGGYSFRKSDGEIWGGGCTRILGKIL